MIVADEYLRALGRFCERIKVTPKQFVKMPKSKMEDITQDFINDMESRRKPSGEQYSPGYISLYLKAIRSWAEHNHKRLERKIKISNPNKRPTLENERTPTKDELKSVLYNDKTPLRTRACIALIAFSGTRIEVLGNYLGLDGLKIKDFPEIEIKDDAISFAKVPTMVVVREELSKARHRYLTFLGGEGSEIVRQHLERRLKEGERLTSESGIISTSEAQALKSKRLGIEDRSPFLRTTKIGDEIRKSMRAVGLPWRPYVFRSYFDTALMLADSKGLVSHAYQQFWMGHKGDMEAQYTTNKKKLPDEVIEDMREAYGRVQELLQTSRSETANEDKVKRTIKEQLMLLAGFKKEEIEKMDLDTMNADEMHQKARERFLGAMVNNGSRQKVIPIVQVEDFVTQGWEYVAPLPHDRAVMKLPM